MAQQGKIDRVYEEVIKMDERFNQLEINQRIHFEQHIEKASASIIAEIIKNISQLTEKINFTQEKGKRKEREPNKEINKIGWHPENLEIEGKTFYSKKK